MTARTNLAASVAARLLNRTRETGDDSETTLTSFCLERFLYRLGVSDRHDRFVLKGAMLLRLWSERPYRATRDLDLLRRGDGTFDAIRDDLRAIAVAPVLSDAGSFHVDGLRLEAIRAEVGYAGTRGTLAARCGVTCPDQGVVVLRVLASRVEPAMALLQSVRAAWRREAWHLAPNPPRIWQT